MNIVNYASDTFFAVVVGVPHALVDCASHTGKTAIGVAATALSVLTLGLVEPINDWADMTVNAIPILPRIYHAMTQIVNPGDSDPSTIRMEDAFFTSKIATPIFDIAMEAASDEFFLNKHIISRGAFVLGTLVAIVTRTADLILGLIVAAISIIPCFGRVEEINIFARNQLAFFGVIHDVCAGLRGLVNPQQFLSE
ncbi:MAG: hypothetical protein H0T62_13840 [Parachlamydiaceae bacterium]|nr:hypothetical protein [Parachlamydiaceae bacterium]